MLSYRNITTLYVAPDGKGNGKYSHAGENSDGPLGSLAQAFSMIEQMRGGGMLQPITVRMRAGEYPLAEPVVIRPTMSNVTVEPYGDGDVLLSGAKKITGFVRSEFQGVPCFAASVPEVKDGSWKFTDLYVDGLRADHTRLPKTGWFRMKATEVPSSALFASSKWFQAEEQDARLFASLHAFEDCIVSFNHYWIDEHTPVEALDAESGKVTMTYFSRFNIRPEQTYILENVAEQFRNPNEWYLDRAEGMLYYIPRDDSQTPESIAVYAPVASKLLRIEGERDNPVTGLRFYHLNFAYTRGDYGSCLGVHGEDSKICASDAQAVANADGSVSLCYARNVVFADCTMRCFGVHGFNITDGCHAVRIERTSIYDGGAGGVRICGGAFGSPESERTVGCAVTDCTILHVGRRYLSACGVLVMHASETDILYNEIGDLFYTGISCGWTWGYAKTVCRDNRIIGNHIYDLGKGQLSDMGGVYLLGSQPGTVVSGNHIHDIRCRDYGGWALYTDEGSAGILLENNLCHDTSSNSYHQHYGSSNVVRNNIFADAGESLLRCSRPEPHLSILFTDNIVYSSGTPMMADYGQGAGGVYTVDDGSIVSMRNCFFCHTGPMTYSEREDLPKLSDAQALGLEAGSIEADPLFVDAEHGDYTLRPESPAIAAGFRPFDWKSCGPRKAGSCSDRH